MQKTSLTNEEIGRYSRQLLVPSIGVKGQENLCNASVLVVGAGGLGCPCLMYLAGAGIGKNYANNHQGHIGIVDYDELDKSNLPRQVIHPESAIGMSKAQSAANFVKSMNSNINCMVFNVLLDKSNAIDIISRFQIVVDATDNVATRYLLNDACVLLGKPLVSGGALRMDGQVTVYNYKGGPCYRCIFPTPPPPETVSNCNDNGVIGAITGVIGSLQALEVIKLIAGDSTGLAGKLMVFDGETTTFRKINLRTKRTNCSVCGDNPEIKELIDYVQFCGAGAHDKALNLKVLGSHQRIQATEYKQILDQDLNHVLIDVREKVQYDICSLPSIRKLFKVLMLDVPFKDFEKKIDYVKEKIGDAKDRVFIVCRLGNDSQLAVKVLEQHGIVSKDIIGGLKAWSLEVDSNFPIY